MIACLGLENRATAVDLSAIARLIDREPKYESGAPKYCLMAFGAEAERSAWFVLDGKRIFVDRNSNRDLTDDGKPLLVRLVNENPAWKLLKESRHFVDLRDPGVKTFSSDARDVPLFSDSNRYTRFQVDIFLRDPEYRPHSKREGEQFERFLRTGENFVDITVRVGGKFSQRGHVRLASNPQEAPVVHFDGPVNLKLENQGLTLGPGTDVPLAVNLVTIGSDEETLTFHNPRKLPEGGGLTAEIQYPGMAQGNPGPEIQLDQSLADIGYLGYVAVPESAPSGIARIDVRPNGRQDLPVQPLTVYVPVMDPPPVDDLTTNEAPYNGQGAALLGKRAPEFEATLMNGKTRSLEDYDGKVVVISFWGTWCASCLAELPILSDLQAEYGKQGLHVLTINCDEDRSAVEKFLKNRDVSLPVVMDLTQKLREQFEVKSLPQLIVIDTDGTVSQMHDQFSRRLRKELRSKIEELLPAQ